MRLTRYPGSVERVAREAVGEEVGEGDLGASGGVVLLLPEMRGAFTNDVLTRDETIPEESQLIIPIFGELAHC